MSRPKPSKPIDSTVMRRLDALEKLINDEYDGKPKLFEERTGVKMAQVGQWFTGYRALRDKALRRLEETTGKPEGWFDAQSNAINTGDSGQSTSVNARNSTINVTSAPAGILLSDYAHDLAVLFDRLTTTENRADIALACRELIKDRTAESSSSVPNQSSRKSA